eukprot:408822-Prymnesium_polylepis.1
MDKYKTLEVCGEGTFAIVYEARSTEDGTRVAVKKLKDAFVAPSWEACMQMRELRAFKTVGKHANVVELKELILEKSTLYF